MRTTWRMLASRRDLRLVLAAGLVSDAGDWILIIGLAYRVYAITGSTVASALTMASSCAPRVLLGAVAGVFADRWDRKRTMITADLLLAVVLLPLLLVHGSGQVWIVFVVMFAEGAISQFFSPAALLALARASGRAGAPSRAGSGAAVRERIAGIGEELRDGLLLASRHRVLRALMIFALVTSVGEGIMSTLFTPFVEHVLHGSSQEFGLVVAAQAVGGILGGVLAAGFGRRVRASRLLGCGAIVFGLVDLAIFLYPLGYVAVWPAVVGMVVVGLPGALTMAGLMTLFQRSTADSHRGRVFGALSALEGVTVLAGTLGAGFLSRYAGIVPVLAIQGAGYVVAGLAMLAWLRDGAGEFMAREPHIHVGTDTVQANA